MWLESCVRPVAIMGNNKGISRFHAEDILTLRKESSRPKLEERIEAVRPDERIGAARAQKNIRIGHNGRDPKKELGRPEYEEIIGSARARGNNQDSLGSRK